MDRVPHRLCRDTIAVAIHIPFEYMHIFHVAQFRCEWKLLPSFYDSAAIDNAILSFRNAKVGLAGSALRQSSSASRRGSQDLRSFFLKNRSYSSFRVTPNFFKTSSRVN